MKLARLVLGIVVLGSSTVAVTACSRRAQGPSTEYTSAMKAYEEAQNASRSDHNDKAFDAVIPMLRAVPETNPAERTLAETLLASIEADRAVKAKADGAQQQRPATAPVGSTAASAAASGAGSGSGTPSGSSSSGAACAAGSVAGGGGSGGGGSGSAPASTGKTSDMVTGQLGDRNVGPTRWENSPTSIPDKGQVGHAPIQRAERGRADHEEIYGTSLERGVNKARTAGRTGLGGATQGGSPTGVAIGR